MLQQPRTPINLVAVKIMMPTLFEAIAGENRTCTAFQTVITKTLWQPCFEMSTLHDDLNLDGLALNAADGASGGGTCRCTCNGRHEVLHINSVSNRKGTPLPPDVSGVPPAPVAACVVTGPARTLSGRAEGAPGAKVRHGFENARQRCWSGSCRFSHAAKAVTTALPPAAPKAASASAIDASTHAEFQAVKRFKTQCKQQVETEMQPDADSKFLFFRSFTFLLDENGQLNYNIDITEPKAWI